MDATDTRVTRERITKTQAASLAGVSPRQINRWAAAGLLSVERGANGPTGTEPTTYDPEEVMAAEAEWNAWGREAAKAAAAPPRGET